MASPSRSSRATSTRFLPLLALSGLLLLWGCDGEDEAEPVGQELGGSVAHLAQCSDWNGATHEEKLATIEELRSQVNREDAGVTSAELSDGRALDALDGGCSRIGSDGFRLHIIYARAAAFEPLRKIASGEAETPQD